jgi:putative transposase
MVAPLVRATIGDGPEFVAKAVRDWITAIGAKTACIEPGSPLENGYCESFNTKLRDALLDGEIFYSLAKAKIVIESWRRHCKTHRTHTALGYPPPAPEAVQWPAPPSGAASRASPTVAV